MCGEHEIARITAYKHPKSSVFSVFEKPHFGNKHRNKHRWDF